MLDRVAQQEGPLGRLAVRVRRKVEWERRRRRGLVDYPSEYLNWMQFANAGMLHPGHRHLVDLAVRELPTDDPVLEIGSFWGLSTNLITWFLREHGRPNELFSADPWVFEGENGPVLPGSDIPFSAYRELVREQFERNVRFWSGDRLAHAYPLASDDFFAAWDAAEEREDVFGRGARLGGPIAFAFIDGDHRYEQALRDFANVDRLLVPGGLVIFDDSDELGGFPHLHELVVRVRHDQGYELVEANPNHLLRKP